MILLRPIRKFDTKRALKLMASGLPIKQVCSVVGTSHKSFIKVAGAEYYALLRRVYYGFDLQKDEHFKSIKGSKRYRVSNYGVVECFKPYANLWKPLKPYKDKKGYYRTRIGAIKTTPLTHKIVAEAFIKRSNTSLQVNHINGVKTDNRVSNLEWVTSAENNRHAARLGLSKSGCQARDAKLTKRQVIFIYNSKWKITSDDLAKRYGVHKNAIKKIWRRKTYRNETSHI